MLPWDNLRAGHNRRTRRRTDFQAIEVLEGRQLLSYSSLGYSLPDLRVSGGAGPVAAWGSTLQVSVTLQNLGASTIVEPLSLVPVSQVTIGPSGEIVPPYAVPSSSDAPPTQMDIYISTRPRSLSGALKIGSIDAPPISQNNIDHFAVPITLPVNPIGFPTSGVFYIRLVANADRALPESNYDNNVSQAIPVRLITRALPELRATALDLPPVMQPGDTVAPTFQITNFGTQSTAPQGSVEVALVASTSPDFNLGSTIVGLYTLTDEIPSQSETPVRNSARKHRRLFGPDSSSGNVNPGRNVLTFTGSAVTLPTAPGTYYVGLVIDPNNKLNQLSQPSNRLELVRQVGPAIAGLPPAGVVSTALAQEFPNPPDGVPIGTVNTSAL